MLLAAWLTGAGLRGAEFFGYPQAPNHQFIDFQPANAGAANGESTNRDCAEGYGTDCDCAQRKAANCKRAAGESTQGLRAGALLPQFATGGVP